MSNINSPSIVNKDIQTSLGLVAALSILIVIFTFIIMPLFNDSQALRRQITQNQTTLTQLKAKNQQLASAKQKLAAIASDVGVLDEAMPNYSDTPQVMSIIEKMNTEILEEGGPLLIESIYVSEMPNDLPNSEQIGVTPSENIIQINFIGDYQAIQDFITKIKSLRHNFFVDKITLSAAKSTKNSQFLTIGISLHYYYFK